MLAIAIFAFVVLGAWHGTGVATAVADIGTAAAALVAAGCAASAAHRGAGRGRTAWTLIAGGAASWGIGQSVWSWYELAGDSAVPFPSLADVGYLAAIPLMIAGVVAYPGRMLRGLSIVRTALDGAMVATALLLVDWALGLGGLYRSGTELTGLESTITLAYPVGDVILLTIALLVLRRAAAGYRQPLALLIAGFAALGFADTMFATLAVSDGFETGGAADVGWFVAFALCALAAFSYDEPPARVIDDQLTRVDVLLPYGTLVAAGAAVSATYVTQGSLDSFEVTTATVLVLLLVVRQTLAVFDNIELTNRLAAREHHFRSLVHASSDVTTLLDRHGIVRWQSPAIERVCGYRPEELEGRPGAELVHPEDLEAFVVAFAEARRTGASVVVEYRVRDKAGSWRPVEGVLTDCLDDPAVAGIVVNSRDVTDRRELERRLRVLAFRDELTGLANRALLRDRIAHAIAGRDRSGATVALLFIDLDGFKQVNDTLGHAQGDALLVEAAARLTDAARPGDTVARLGGDEFAVLLELASGDGHAWHIAQRLLERLRDPYVLAGADVSITASIGVAAAGDGIDADVLLQEADLAMYAAKSAGKSRCALYDPEMRARIMHRAELERDLREALAAEALDLHFQPVLELATETIVGVEALVRWTHPVRGVVSPAEFIGVAEESGLIDTLGAWVLERACQFGARLHEAGHPLRIAVNLSPRQIKDPLLPFTVSRALAGANLSPGSLLLEITESLVVEDTAATVRRLVDLRQLGVSLAIDDFGTGYSSMSYLPRLPIDVIKVDRSFTGGVATAHDLRALTAAVVNLGAELGLEVIAEGIEDEDQLAALHAMGCRFGQGYLFAAPLRGDDLLRHLAERRLSGLPLPRPRSSYDAETARSA